MNNAKLFNDRWMKQYQDAWNDEQTMGEMLRKAGFNSTIGCGFKGEDNPRGVLVVKEGKAVHAGEYGGENLDWDLRAEKAHWRQWQEEGVGMAALGIATISGKLTFNVGDFSSMIVQPELARPFVKSFSLMKKVT
ncbi:MAG: SCP-2 sterol transfer family protein [Methylococcales bacterium]|jgi:hypothetical protein|nr:SCP-2 sterol transfer family protein [Methylococcales bacterium]MBT7445328.1 SCP-2 sterol transfer family protein [Methylococcales bacterium]